MFYVGDDMIVKYTSVRLWSKCWPSGPNYSIQNNVTLLHQVMYSYELLEIKDNRMKQ